MAQVVQIFFLFYLFLLSFFFKILISHFVIIHSAAIGDRSQCTVHWPRKSSLYCLFQRCERQSDFCFLMLNWLGGRRLVINRTFDPPEPFIHISLSSLTRLTFCRIFLLFEKYEIIHDIDSCFANVIRFACRLTLTKVLIGNCQNHLQFNFGFINQKNKIK